jgi:hypothetical protein
MAALANQKCYLFSKINADFYFTESIKIKAQLGFQVAVIEFYARGGVAAKSW